MSYYVGIHFETKIDDVLIKYISSFEEAKNYILNNRGNRMLLFYQKGDISIDEHIELSKLQWNLQIYTIIDNFIPSNLECIAKFLYKIYVLVFSSSVFSSLKKVNEEDIRIINILMNNIEQYMKDNHFIDMNIIIECKNTLLKILTNNN